MTVNSRGNFHRFKARIVRDLPAGTVRLSIYAKGDLTEFVAVRK